MKNTYKHLIFDFDGTIVDSFDTMLHIFNQLSAEFSIEPLSKQEVSHLRDMSPKELLGHLVCHCTVFLNIL